ncbi:MAG: 2-C-methyl-D-erythritol 4-phosphate cytidylyltransferase [Pirellulaceae bacterium]
MTPIKPYWKPCPAKPCGWHRRRKPFARSYARLYMQAHPNPSQATDEASLVEAFGHAVTVVEGSPLNIKVTTQADLKFAELALKALPKSNPFPFADT